MPRCQILERNNPTKDEPEPKWKFVAHGARYDHDAAKEMAALIRSRGDRQARIVYL